MLGVELLENVGLEFSVESHRLDDLLTLLVARLLHEVGDLGGVQLGELSIRDAKSRRRNVSDERLDRGEIDNGFGLHPLSDLLAQNPSQEWPATGVDTDDFPSSVDLGNLDLVGDDQASTYEVYEVARQEVFGEQ